MTTPQNTGRVKFYADAPDGVTKNKYMVYAVQDVKHSIDLVNRFIEKGWKVRAAFFQTLEGANIKIPINILN